MRCDTVLIFILFAGSCCAALGEEFDLDLYGPEIEELNQTYVRGTEVEVFKTQAENAVSLNRRKRGWVSVLIYGGSILTRLGSLGYNLAQVISGGCAVFPSICSDTRAIENLDAQIRSMKNEYDQLYMENKKAYLDLRTGSTDNGYISYYINETLRAVQTVEEIQETISDTLEIELPKLFLMFEASKNNATANQYLEAIVGKLDFTLESIKGTIEEMKKQQLIGIVASYLIEVALNKFGKAYSKAFSQVRQFDTDGVFASSALSKLFQADVDEAGIMLDPNHPRHNEVMQEHGLTTGSEKKFRLTRNCKYALKAFKQMGKNLWGKLKGIQTGIKKWRRINNMKGFVGKLKHSLRRPIQKLTNIKKFIVSSTKRKYFVSKFKLGWSGSISTTLGLISDAVTIALSTENWREFAGKIRESRSKYEEYRNNLIVELKTIRKENKQMSNMWPDVIGTFKDLTLAFKGLIENATKNGNFAEVVGLPKLPVDVNSPLFTIDLARTDRSTIRRNQGIVVAFLQGVDNNMTKVVDAMRARQILYTNVLTMTEANETIKDMLDDAKNIYKYSPSSTIRTFGEQLKTKDVVCTVAQLRDTIKEYDFYPLESFKPRCDVNSTIFTKFEQDASLLRKGELMSKVVSNYKGSSLLNLLDRVKGAYLVHSDPDLQAFGETIAEEDVLCVISKEFPNQQVFDFFSLKPFRPDCSFVTVDDFRTMKRDADHIRGNVAEITITMEMCEKYNFCPCPTLIASQNEISEDDVIVIIRNLKPDMTKYCGTTGCACINL